MIYTESEHVPKAISEALDSVGSHDGMKIPKMLANVSRHLDKATSPSAGSKANPVDLDGDSPMTGPSEQESNSEDDEEANADSDDDAWSPKSPKEGWDQDVPLVSSVTDPLKASLTRDRIRSDLSLAKKAGFRVSLQGSLLDGGQQGYVTLSIRVNKLGISDEALQAWDMNPQQYFILFIRYMAGYQTLDTITGGAMSNASNLITLRTCLYDRYKVTGNMNTTFASLEGKITKPVESSNPVPKLGRLFIVRPLDELLNKRLLPLLRYRMAMGFPWRGAEEFLNDHQGRNLDSEAPDTKYWAEDQSDKASSLPSIVMMDHLTSSEKEKSLPLIAIQFALRHLVRCTEFCLVCHCKIEADFEALKPYVCSKPLCLYQYMSLGFGPSIEHEIISQPLVVDLLVSFCYASASPNQLRYLPTGMALMVPAPTRVYCTEYSSTSLPNALGSKVRRSTEDIVYKARFDPLSRDMLLTTDERPPLQVGTWIKFNPPGSPGEAYHARVDEVLFPTVRLAKHVSEARNKVNTLFSSSTDLMQILPGKNVTNIAATLTPATTPPGNFHANPSSPFRDIDFVIYDKNFDELTKPEQCKTICLLLDTLPSVAAMRDYLLAKGRADVPLRAWTDRLSPASLGILRWIIASNRSCIVQVDSLGDTDRKSEERVSGMPGWTQFRLAQGAPDKEQRFVQSIRNTTSQSKHPTLFAWHGSPLHNWHGIVREGLHFEQTSHGRAFGDGVYHALDVSTSLSYTNMGSISRVPSIDDADKYNPPGRWPHSQLKIAQALTLNEIVNAPDQFVSKTPHLVVAQLDWIQSRYLFVMCHNVEARTQESTPTQELAQDPAFTPLGSSRTKLVIPLNAISKSRRPNPQVPSDQPPGDKKRKAVESSSEADLALTDDTDEEDNLIYLPLKDKCDNSAENPAKRTPAMSKGKNKSSTPTATTPLTDFTPGTHNQKTLPLLEPPSYATLSATRTLQRELNATLKILDTHPAHELGWYIDRELITNMYQWIIELHSFEPHLPLSKDLRAKSIKSVLIELRFGKDYPMTPPFVRIIRPRFLSFMAGGGGHVTAGGALCMELLTNSGWSAVNNIESVLLQVRLALSSMDPKPARLEDGHVRDYGTGEAVEAYLRACRQHGVSLDTLNFTSDHSHIVFGLCESCSMVDATDIILIFTVGSPSRFPSQLQWPHSGSRKSSRAFFVRVKHKCHGALVERQH